MDIGGVSEYGGHDRKSDWYLIIHNPDCVSDIEKSSYLSGRLSSGHTGEMYGIRIDRKREQTLYQADILRKGIALLAFVFIFAVVLKQFNGADTFWKGVRDSYMIWLIIDWYDALVLDSIWFCHSKKVRIPGTEDMEEYKDYCFHIKQSCIGMLLGLPACLAVGVITAIL
mgnify:CR=1 FL=1